MKAPPLHDVLAGVLTLLLGVGAFVLLLTDRPVPEWWIAAVSAAIAWAFRGGLDGLNQRSHDHNGGEHG